MRYLFLAYGDEQWLATLSTSEHDAFQRACLANDEMLGENGHLLAVESLQSGSTAITVRTWNDEIALTEGPFAEPKGQLIGLYFIHARDLNEAIQVAAQMPQARRGPIEVMPLVA